MSVKPREDSVVGEDGGPPPARPVAPRRASLRVQAVRVAGGFHADAGQFGLARLGLLGLDIGHGGACREGGGGYDSSHDAFPKLDGG